MKLCSDRENTLARAIQHGFPLEPDPWLALERRTAIDAGVVREQIERWFEEGKLREISAVLEGSLLGYDSSLCAGEVPESDLERVAAIIGEHPTVTHNYRRDHRYNLWFTLAVPAEMGIESTLDALARRTGIEQFHALRRTSTFKIGVNFDLKRRCSSTRPRPMTSASPPRLEPGAVELFRALQTPLPLVDRPFRVLAEAAGVDEPALLDFAFSHYGGAIRRYVGTFRHRSLGVQGNGMAVWKVHPSDHERVGHILACATEVSHCYARNSIEGFPYTVYSMLHGPNRESVEAVARRLAKETGIDDYLILFSSHEYKKCRLRYFLLELDAWWRKNATDMAA